MLKRPYIANIVNTFLELTDETRSQANPFNTKPSQFSCDVDVFCRSCWRLRLVYRYLNFPLLAFADLCQMPK